MSKQDEQADRMPLAAVDFRVGYTSTAAHDTAPTPAHLISVDPLATLR
jgi:hypothetical protein